MNHKPPSVQDPQRLVFIVGLTIGLSIMGDSFLYGNLPIEAENLGIAFPLVGILLSGNRLVRLVSNTWASSIFEKLGPRKPFVASTVMALITTALYGVGWGFTVFLLARMGWGIAWSALRQGGYQAIWTGGPQAKGKLMGFLWGMIRLGSAFSVLLGGYLRDLWGYRVGILGVTFVSLLAIPVALSIRWPAEAQRISSSRQSFRDGWKESLKTERGRRLLLAGSMHTLFEGVLIATASLFLARRLGDVDFLSFLGVRIGTIAGLLLALRWTSDILFAPGIGWMSDRLGQAKSLGVLVCVLLVSLAGTVSLGGPFLVLSLAFLFVSSAGLNIILSALANGLSVRMDRPHIFLGVYATAVDGGAALGPLLAYSVGTLTGFATLYTVIGVALALAIFRYSWPRSEDAVGQVGDKNLLQG